MHQHPQHLYEYHVWANERILSHLEQLPGELYATEVQSVFPSIAQTLAHIYLFDQLWLSVLKEVPNEEIFPMINIWNQEAQNKEIMEMRQLFAKVADQYRTLFLQTPDPDKAMTIEHPQYGRLDTFFSEIVHHVVNHGTYHRGNITAMLRQMGHPGVATDYVFYLLELQG